MTQAGAPAVLVVEDESIVAHDIQQTLAGLGYDAFAIASSAEEALARSSERCPNVVLMDIRIAGALDGISTADLLQRRFDAPVVYLTAHADDATIDRAKRTQPYGYLVKPVNSAELRGALEVALYKHELDRRLHERERWFSTTLRSIADAVVAVDLGGRITFMNPPAESLTGWKADEALGLPAREVVRLQDPQAGDRPETPLDRALRERRTVEVGEAGLRNAADGQVRSITNSASPVVDGTEALGAVMVFRDVTEQRKLECRIEQADRLASLGTMAAGVAHEINNPLGVVVGGVEIVATGIRRQAADLETARDPDRVLGGERLRKALHTLSLVESAAARIQAIVSQMQSFTRPSPPESSRTRVERAVEWAVSTTSQELRHRARVVWQPGTTPLVKADEVRLGQVFVNLLLNAAQAIPPGDAERNEVQIIAGTDRRGWVVVEVRDTGSGIPPETLERIFEPFFTTKPVGVGTGLGLAVCHGIVTALGGELTVESRVGEGSSFRVALPPAPVEVREEAPPAPAGGALPRRRLLVIDDEKMILEILAENLAEHEVVCTSRAEDALRLIEGGECFDLILCDLMMPEMTGIDLYESLLGSHPEQARRMAFMTGGATTARSEAFLRGVPNPTLTKPFSAAQLQDALERSLPGD